MKRFLSRGYFPPELPPPFHTREFAQHMTSSAPSGPYVLQKTKEPNFITRPVTYNLARAGSLRRQLAIPNPVNFYLLAGTLVANWAKMVGWYAKSKQALSRPKRTSILAAQDRRAYEWTGSLGDLPERRAQIRSGMRYALQTDINRFYPSIYTHSVPWAIHGKKKSQSTIGWGALSGNNIDRLLQIGQSKQTKGIPIGPDTSFLVAEILLSRMDRKLVARLGNRFIRYLDDYEFAFKTFNEAEKGLSVFLEVLSEFELVPNEAKTKIIELPAPLDNAWPRLVRSHLLEGAGRPRMQHTSLIDFFNISMELWKQYPDQAVIRYTVSKSAGTVVAQENWLLYQRLLSQWSQAEPSVLPLVLDILAVYRAAGFQIDLNALAELLHHLVQTHAPRGHTSEVAWALWGHILFDIPLDSTASTTTRRMDNPVIALLALDARDKGLIPKTAAVGTWKAHMTPDELKTEHWLLAYEARVKKWLPPLNSSKEYIKTAVGFANLGTAGVSFYDNQCAATYVPSSMLLLRARLAIIAGEGDAYF